MLFKIIKVSLVFCFATFFSAAYANECFVLYKAKKDNPLKLHLGLIQISGQCSEHDVEYITSRRLNLTDWKLLKIVKSSSNIDAEKMERDLGDYFLKY
jgi:hypothetical protein